MGRHGNGTVMTDDTISRRDFVILTGSAAATVGAGGIGAAGAESPSDHAVRSAGGGSDVRHSTRPIDGDADIHVWTGAGGCHRLELAPFETAEPWVAFHTPTDTPLRTTLARFQRGEGHDRIRAALGDATLQHALAVARRA